MNRLFLRFFLLVMSSVTVASVALYFLISYYFGDPFVEIARKQASAELFVLAQYVDKAPPDEWLQRLNKVREVSRSQLDLIPLADALAAVPASARTTLQRGDVVLDIPHKAFYRRVDLDGSRYVGSDSEVIHAQGLPIDIGLAVKMELLRYIVVALALLVPIAFWSRNHWRDLQALSRAAEQFGEQGVAPRLHIARQSALFPLAQRMTQMTQRIASLLEAQRSLLHAVSHELRTPIARLSFGLTLLSEEAEAELPPARLAAMETDIEELDTLVNELLSLNQLDQPQALQATPFAIADLLDDAVQHTAHLFTDKTLAVALANDLGNYTGDRRQLTRVLSNLLRNAAKYSRTQVRLAARRTADQGLELMVDDDGPGIPPEARARIFEPFYRLDVSRDQDTGGVGLGLAIAQKATALHGGTIVVAEAELGGARFIVSLPALRG